MYRIRQPEKFWGMITFFAVVLMWCYAVYHELKLFGHL